MDRGKLTFVGLDNAGKTSIIQFLQKRLTLGETIVPTKKAEVSSQEISLLGLDVTHWDLGGQEQYRTLYFQNKKKYFSDVPILIFVIDIKDKARHDTALAYLKKVMETLKELGNETKVLVLFHKYDPNSFEISDLLNYSEDLREKILKFQIFTDITFYKTSVYSNISLLEPFSDLTTSLSGKPQFIQNLLTDYCEKTKSNAAILFDTRNFIVDEKAEKGVYIKVLEVVAETYASGIEKMEDWSLETLDIMSQIKYIDAQSDDNRATILIQIVKKVPRLYVVILTLNSETKDLAYKHLSTLADKITELLNN